MPHVEATTQKTAGVLEQLFAAPLFKYLLATLFQGTTATLSLLFQKVTHALNVFQHRIQLHHLARLQLVPTNGRGRSNLKSKKQLLDFS